MDVLSIIKSSLFAFVSSVARNLLLAGLTWLVSRKVIDEATSSQLLTFAPMVLAAVAWSFVEKYVLAKLHFEKLQTALNLPTGSTLAHLDEALRKQKE
jgi:hypothetical protein